MYIYMYIYMRGKDNFLCESDIFLYIYICIYCGTSWYICNCIGVWNIFVYIHICTTIFKSNIFLCVYIHIYCGTSWYICNCIWIWCIFVYIHIHTTIFESNIFLCIYIYIYCCTSWYIFWSLIYFCIYTYIYILLYVPSRVTQYIITCQFAAHNSSECGLKNKGDPPSLPPWWESSWDLYSRFEYGLATTSRLLKIIGLFGTRALWKRRYCGKKTCDFKEPTNNSHTIVDFVYWNSRVRDI